MKQTKKETMTTDHNKKGVCYSKYATRPILYTDKISGKQVLRDDLWAVSTEELNDLQHTIDLLTLKIMKSKNDTN